VPDPADSRRIFVTTGRGFYTSPDAGASWKYLKGLNRSYTVPLLVTDRDVFIAAAAGPPPLWPMGSDGADALLFQSADHGRTFTPMMHIDGLVHPSRGMVMRLLTSPANHDEFFGVLTDGSVIRGDRVTGIFQTIAEKLPPAYDFAVIP
jgi:hypothetical protein